MNLEQQWIDAKAKEKEANQHRIDIEHQILATVTLKETGVNHLELVKVTTAHYRKWEQEKVQSWKDNWATLTNTPFPFKVEYKEVAKDMKGVDESLVKKLEFDCLTITPAKPSFAIK